MEYASYLAGERWSDHPACTHPLLALLARGVNDHTSEEGRSRLVPLIPSVVGMTGDNPGIDISIAIRSGAAALPVSAMDRQKALAVGLLVSLEVLDGSGRRGMTETHARGLVSIATGALDAAPHATRWARDFVDKQSMSRDSFRTRSAPAIVRAAVTGIADMGTADCDRRLYRLLSDAIDDCRALTARSQGTRRFSFDRAGRPA